MKINIKRVYEAPAKEDSIRILVDRLWPRGLTKEKASVDLWVKRNCPPLNFVNDLAITLINGQRFRNGITKNSKRIKSRFCF